MNYIQRDNPRAELLRVYEDREAVVAEICERLELGEGLANICRDAHMPGHVTVWNWEQSTPAIAEAIRYAREAGEYALAQQAQDIVDGLLPVPGVPPDPSRDKARADVRLRLLAKFNPKRWGDSTQLRHADADGGKLDTAPLVSELMGLMGHKPQITIESTARNVTPSAFGKPLIEPGSAPPVERAKPRAAYRPRGAKDVGDLV